MYLIVGCDDIGYTVASRLRERNEDVVIVEDDPKKVGPLRLLGFKVVSGDPRSPETLNEASLSGAHAVLIAEADFRKRVAALEAVNRMRAAMEEGPLVIVLASDESEIKEMVGLGAEECLSSKDMAASEIAERMEKAAMSLRERKLRSLLKKRARGGMGEMAIILQTNPDPDSIASAAALKLYAKSFGVDSRIVYDGVIGHLQNRALVNVLGLEMLEAKNVDFNSFSTFALVDVATKSHCCLPEDKIPTIVIDHHSVPAGDVGAVHVDITPVGAASTILTNYLRSAGIQIDRGTAAALMLGILTDTMNFSRGTTPHDFEAFTFLHGLADQETLRRLVNPPVSSEALDVLSRAIRASKLNGTYLTSYVGQVSDRDMIAQAADFLLEREGVSTTFVYGICGDYLYASARTKDLALNLGQTLRKAFGGKFAGGHPHMAGATIPIKMLRITPSTSRTVVRNLIAKRFLETAGVIKPSKRTKRSGALPWDT